MRPLAKPHAGIRADRKLTTLARHISKFGLFPGSKIFLANYFATSNEIKLKVPGLEEKVTLRNSTSDAYCFNQVFLDLDYDFDLPFTPSFIVDCGANIGLSSLFFHRKYPGAQIVAAEPEASNFEMLVRNTKAYTNIYPYRYGIWNKCSSLEIVNDGNGDDKWGFKVKETQPGTAGSIRSITIEEIMKRFGREEIDILKMDIEGSEIEVFSSDYESWLPKIRIIMIELHDRGRKDCAKTFFKTLFQYDFSINQYHRGEIIMCIRNS
jgi:FkbM family methyltransferase